MNGRYPFLFCLQVILQIALIGGAALGGLAGDAAHTDKACQIGVQAVHAQRGTGLQDAWDLVALALTDEVCHGIGADQNLGRGAAALAPASGRSCWVMTPRSTAASWPRIWFCAPAGQTSIMRSMVWAAPIVCSVLRTRWPVSAAVTAAEIVS